MKRIFITVLFVFITMVSYSQIKVLSVEPDEADLTARINPKQDRNGFDCAMLRITTIGVNGEQRRKFRFMGDMATQIVDVSFPDGEIMVYLSPGRSQFILIHDDYGREIYEMPYDLKPKTCYRMVITANKEEVVKNYLLIRADQPNALIYVDDVFVGEKEVFLLYNAGDTHKWRIECDMYHTESGEVKISYSGKTEIEKTLRPAFGYLNITTMPESGATVYVDGKKIGETPYMMEKVKSGNYEVRVVKDMYYPEEKSFEVMDGDTTNAVINMRGNYAEVTVETDPESDIYVDNEYKGKGSWTGRMMSGEHLFEAKKESHKEMTVNMNLKAGMKEKVLIPNPEPVYGMLNVATMPIGAKIYIDDKMVGITPDYIKDVMIGNRELRLEKQGYLTVRKTVTIEEGKELILNEKMSSVGREVAKVDEKPETKILNENTNKIQDKPAAIVNKKKYKNFDFSCGPMIGLQMNSMANGFVNVDWNTGMTFGVFTCFSIKRFLIQPEVLYNKSVFDFTAKISGQTGNISRSYLNIPLLLGYQTKGETFKMRFAAGPVCKLLVGQKIDFGNMNVSSNAKFKSELAVAINVGVDLNRITIDLKYDLGLTKQIDKDRYYYEDIVSEMYYEYKYYDLSELQQHAITLTIGYRLF